MVGSFRKRKMESWNAYSYYGAPPVLPPYYHRSGSGEVPPNMCGYARVSSTPYQDLELVAESKAGNTAKACLRPSSASKKTTSIATGDQDDVAIIDDDDDQPEVTYSLKMMNPARMSDFKTVSVTGQKHCDSLDELKSFLTDKVPTVPDFCMPDFQQVELGYFEPGHGTKGRKLWLYSDNDLKEMYCIYSTPGRRVILLWCYTQTKTKTKVSKSAKAESSKSTGESLKVLSDVDEYFEKLKEKHKGAYSPEQMRAWAHLLQMQKHESLEDPPDKPFFRGRKRPLKQDTGSAPESKKKKSECVSPGRKVSMRTELIAQLEKWHNLLENGAVAQGDYEELKTKILSDIKEL